MPFFINISLIFFTEHLLNTINSLYLYVEAKKNNYFTNPKNFLL